MRFSLITATLGRREELITLMESLCSQDFKDFEFILVDQNTDGRLDDVVAQFADKINLTHIKSDIKGLSYNRNLGLEVAKGEIVAFPDDDSFYALDVLTKMDRSFKDYAAEKLRLLKIEDPVTKKVWLEGKLGLIYRSELMKYANSINIFLVRRDGMKFDSRLGVGAEFGSGEESDFLWNELGKDDCGRFVDAVVYHLECSVNYRDSAKLYSYGLGWGAIFKKEIYGRGNRAAYAQFIYGLVRSIGGMVLKPEKKAYLNILKGRIKGFLSFPKN